MLRRFVHYSFLLASMAMVGVNIVTSKYLLNQHMPVFALLFARFWASVILLLLFYCHKPQQLKKYGRALDGKDWSLLIAQGLCAGILFNLLMLMGLHDTSANMAGIITSALPAMIALLSWLILRERFGKMMWLCIIFATLGILVVNLVKLHHGGVEQNSIWGDLIILSSLIPEAMYYVLIKVKHIALPNLFLSLLLSAVNAVALVPLMLYALWHYDLELVTVNQWLLAGLIGAASALFFLCWGAGGRHVPVSIAGLFTATVPIFTLLLSWLFLGEVLNQWQYIGMAMVLISIVFSTRSRVKTIE